MNIMERTPAAIRVQIDGMIWEQVRDMIEERFGALMWGTDGRAYPADGVTIRMTWAEPAGDVARRSIGATGGEAQGEVAGQGQQQ